jgi:hypothetical protein
VELFESSNSSGFFVGLVSPPRHAPRAAVAHKMATKTRPRMIIYLLVSVTGTISLNDNDR